MKKLLAAISLSALAMPALAVEQGYFGVDYQQTKYTFDSTADSVDYTLDAVRITAGDMLTRHFGLEAHVSVGTESDNQELIANTPASTVYLRLGTAASLNGVARLPIGRGGIYVYAGYAYVESLAKCVVAGCGSANQEDTGLTYGGGLDFPIGYGLNFNVDYSQILDKSNDYKVMGLSAGVRHFF